MRCSWAESSESMIEYHDTEWGVPSHDDPYLFEMLVLEGAQAGLSWSMVLNKRENYRAALDNFDVDRIAAYKQRKLDTLMQDAGIVRNRLKIESLVKNARATLAVRSEFGSFDNYLWHWVKGQPVVSRPKTVDDLKTSDDLSDRVSKDMKKRGFNFVGSTIIYSYLQATGIIDDHVKGCSAIRS